MSTLISLLIGTIALYVLFIQIREYNELNRIKYQFQFFALRDRLAVLVASGHLSEDSWEYKNIVDVLNYHIGAVEKMSLGRIVSALVQFHMSSAEDFRMRGLSKRVSDKAVADIVMDYMSTTYELIRRNSRVQISLIRAAGSILRPIFPKISSPQKLVVNPTRALMAIESHQHLMEGNLVSA